MDFYGFLRISMDFYGFLWISMDFYGFLWISMDLYGLLWISMDFYDLYTPSDSYSLSFFTFLLLGHHNFTGRTFDIISITFQWPLL
jgi:hypothetical protein